MGFFDKIKSAVNAVTGGAARVTLDVPPQLLFSGDEVMVKISATSTGGELKSKGVYVDLRGTESVNVRDEETKRTVEQSRVTIEQSFLIAPEFVLAPDETRLFEGTFRLPPSLMPTFAGTFAQHTYELRGRIEAFGNDPDSGFLPIRVGAKT